MKIEQIGQNERCLTTDLYIREMKGLPKNGEKTLECLKRSGLLKRLYYLIGNYAPEPHAIEALTDGSSMGVDIVKMLDEITLKKDLTSESDCRIQVVDVINPLNISGVVFVYANNKKICASILPSIHAFENEKFIMVIDEGKPGEDVLMYIFKK